MPKFQIDDYVHIDLAILSEWFYAGHQQWNQGYIEAVRTVDTTTGNLYQQSERTRYTVSSDGELWEAWEDELFLCPHPAAHLQERLDL